MTTLTNEGTSPFLNLIEKIPTIGFKTHEMQVLNNVRSNLPFIQKSLKALAPQTCIKSNSAIIVSAGPSVFRKQSIQKILNANYQGTLICVDGSYIACLKAGIIPDFVVTLDPDRTRIVRWFGDPALEENSKNDDCFLRQDLDIEFRKNALQKNEHHIELVNRYGPLTKAIVASCAPSNVVQRILEAKLDTYWWHPLMDDPRNEEGLTRKLYQLKALPCINTGGTVGTAAWIFAASILKIDHLALVGMDLGYYRDTPYSMTQTYYELLEYHGKEKGLETYFKEVVFPLTQEKFYIDPTYYWYRKNFLELYRLIPTKTVNCTEGGTLFGEELPCLRLDQFLAQSEERLR